MVAWVRITYMPQVDDGERVPGSGPLRYAADIVAVFYVLYCDVSGLFTLLLL